MLWSFSPYIWVPFYRSSSSSIPQNVSDTRNEIVAAFFANALAYTVLPKDVVKI